MIILPGGIKEGEKRGAASWLEAPRHVVAFKVTCSLRRLALFVMTHWIESVLLLQMDAGVLRGHDLLIFGVFGRLVGGLNGLGGR